MADIIQLLPDSIANQIAAGEVIQRPASVIKELIENSIDAGSKNIKVFVKEAGKTLIQVIDDGSGMSETDTRMCFERHATSKIKESKDLFTLSTMGFRGEAMASIASIAHIELKTKTENQELGTHITIEGSEVISQVPCHTSKGTITSVKNLFYNVPARRKFLKKNTVEMKHILDEFQRIALSHPDIFFSLTHNNLEIFHLSPGNLRKRILGILGNNVNKKLVPISEETDFVKFFGYVCKPEFTTKKKGEQYFFVNNRFIKSGYLHHAIMGAYENIIPKDTNPLYVVFIEIDPSRIDINVHPTKQEIKFEDERLIYNYLKVCIKQGIGQFASTPALDFNTELSMSPFKTVANPGLKGLEGKDSFSSNDSYTKKTVNFNDYRIKPEQVNANREDNLKNWETLYSGLNNIEDNSTDNPKNDILTFDSSWSEETQLQQETKGKDPYQVHNRFIISQIKSGFILVDQQAAHERILYEQYVKMLNDQKSAIQRELFPKKITLSVADTILLQAILEEVKALGFDIEFTGQTNFILNGLPADIKNHRKEKDLIIELLETFKDNRDLKLDTKENIARSLAKSASTKKGRTLTILEMKELIDKLFACKIPQRTPSGRSCYLTYNLEDLAKMFNK